MTTLQETTLVLQQNPNLRQELKLFFISPAWKMARRFVEAKSAADIGRADVGINPTIQNHKAFVLKGVLQAFELLEYAAAERKPQEPEAEHFAHYANQPDTNTTH